MLTGEPDKVTVQMVAPRQLTSGDVMFAVGKLGRAAGFEPMVGKIAVAKDPTTAVFDMATDAADQLIKFSKEQNLESIEFSMCPVLPLLQEVPVSERVHAFVLYMFVYCVFRGTDCRQSYACDSFLVTNRAAGCW